jgi:hypothetical protein
LAYVTVPKIQAKSVPQQQHVSNGIVTGHSMKNGMFSCRKNRSMEMDTEYGGLVYRLKHLNEQRPRDSF